MLCGQVHSGANGSRTPAKVWKAGQSRSGVPINGKTTFSEGRYFEDTRHCGGTRADIVAEDDEIIARSASSPVHLISISAYYIRSLHTAASTSPHCAEPSAGTHNLIGPVSARVALRFFREGFELILRCPWCRLPRRSSDA